MLLVAGVSACGTEEDYPVPTEGQIVGHWSNPGGDWVDFEKDGTGRISPGAQLQLSELIEEADTQERCEFSWGVDTVPAGGEKWVSLSFSDRQCGSSGPGELGLYFYYLGGSKKLALAPVAELPKPAEIYSPSKATPKAAP
ncbi:hypothetical protein [Streptomyces sp. NPDC051569]|uniref:hypothetical protein n=1 Tax=Streptomyces sp. NPDC051569 TaxID=3365661 RepID=UPI0037AC7416